MSEIKYNNFWTGVGFAAIGVIGWAVIEVACYVLAHLTIGWKP